MGFLSFLFGDPPQPPNPIQTAAAQSASNFGTAIASGYMNNVNQQTPAGNLTYTPDYSKGFLDPLSGYTVPSWTATQTYTPEGQAAFEANQRTAANLARTGEASSNRIGALLGSNFADIYAQAPDAGNVDLLRDIGYATGEGVNVGAGPRDVGPYAGQVTGFGDAGAITRDYGPADNFSADRARVEASLFERMNPQLLQDEERQRQQLADQGIRYGSEAYDRAMDNASRARTDARLAVTAAGGQEQQRLNDMAAQRAGFQNAAQMQAYNQLLGRATFTNQAQMEQFQKQLQAGTFATEAQKNAFTQAMSNKQLFNAAQAQNLARNQSIFQAQNADRSRWLQEQYALRSQPISELSALQSGSQVAQPQWASTTPTNIANTDIAGIINANFSQNMDIYKQNSSNLNNIIGGLFGLAGAGVKSSDRRVKKNVAKVGNVYAARRHDDPKKLPIYSYEYKGDRSGRKHIGPMAQDVEKIDPGAVKSRGGVKHIEKRRVLGDILRVA